MIPDIPQHLKNIGDVGLGPINPLPSLFFSFFSFSFSFFVDAPSSTPLLDEAAFDWLFGSDRLLAPCLGGGVACMRSTLGVPLLFGQQVSCLLGLLLLLQPGGDRGLDDGHQGAAGHKLKHPQLRTEEQSTKVHLCYLIFLHIHRLGLHCM